MRRLAFGLIWLTVFTIPWQNMVLVSSIGTITRAVGMLAAVIGLLAVLSSGRGRRIHPVFVLAYLNVGWTVLSILWSIDTPSSVRQAGTVVQVAVLFWLVWEFSRTREQQTRLLGAYVSGALVGSAAVIYAFVVEGGGAPRYTAPNFNPNTVGILISFAVPIAVYLVWRAERRVISLMSVASIPVLVTGIVLTGSRTAFATTAICMFLVSWAFVRVPGRTKVFLLIAGAVTLYVSTAVVPEPHWQRLSDTFDAFSVESFQTRLTIWRAGLTVLEERPFFGVGAGAFGAAVEPIVGSRRAPHSSYIGSLTETGVIGFTLFVGLLIAGLRAAFGMRSADRWLWLALLAMLLAASGSLTIGFEKQTWFLLGMAFSMRAVSASRVSVREASDPRYPPVFGRDRAAGTNRAEL